MAEATHREEGVALKATGVGRGKLVLIVDDQDINQDVLDAILEDEEYETIFASNGVEALEQVQAHIDDLSIILLDLMMPVMNGFEVIEHVRSDPQMARIPIIVMTSEKDAEVRALQMGAADFITKPFDQHEVILARVARIIELSEGRHLIRATELDPLTKLYTRGYFFEFAERMLRSQSDGSLDAIMLNIDHFHSINDLNGREFGDKTLRLIGDAVRSFLVETDGIASRPEADDFLILCQHQDNYSALLARFQEATTDNLGKRVSLRLRMGVGLGLAGATVDELFDHARTACSMAREDHNLHLMVYDERMREREMHNQQLLNDMGPALAEHQFKVFYQPKYNIQEEPPRLASAEALVRWIHPELGFISPGDFIPLFETEGVIHEVDSYVRAEVIRQIADWRDRLGVSVPVSVNLSRTEMSDPELKDTLDAKMGAYGLTPDYLYLEVTESAYADDLTGIVATINQFRESGYEIEMDDFGSGYSSLNMLSSMPIDVLKMDMKFIQNIEDNMADFRLVELVLDIAKFLQVPVVAEGVETETQCRLLKEAGCELVQGYYFSRPLPAKDFEELLIRELVNKEQ